LTFISSSAEYEAFNAATDNNITLIEEMFEKIESRRQNIIESQTNISCSSRRTDKSQNSSNQLKCNVSIFQKVCVLLIPTHLNC
jgi:hypothetical protein